MSKIGLGLDGKERGQMHFVDDLVVPANADHAKCQWSSGIHDCLTVGRGKLDEYGFWEFGCPTCARRHKGPVWPHKREVATKIF